MNMAVGAVLVFERGRGDALRRGRSSACSRGCISCRATASASRSPRRGVTNPVWVDDADFDLHWHLRPAALPAPRGDLSSRRSSRARCRGAWTALGRCGSSTSSRSSGADLRRSWPRCTTRSSTGSRRWTSGRCCSTRRPEPLEIPPPDEQWRRGPTTAGGTSRGAPPRRSCAASAPDRVGRARAATRARGEAAEHLRRGTDVLTQLARTRPSAPPTPLNAGLIPPTAASPPRRRRCAALKAAGKARRRDGQRRAARGRRRDAARATCEAAGVEPEREPVALVPVSVRREDERGRDRQPHLHRARRPSGRRCATRSSASAESAPRCASSRTPRRCRPARCSPAPRGWAPPLASGMLVRAMGGVLRLQRRRLQRARPPAALLPQRLQAARALPRRAAQPRQPGPDGRDHLLRRRRLLRPARRPRPRPAAVEVAADGLRESLGELVGAAPSSGARRSSPGPCRRRRTWSRGRSSRRASRGR